MFSVSTILNEPGINYSNKEEDMSLCSRTLIFTKRPSKMTFSKKVIWPSTLSKGLRITDLTLQANFESWKNIYKGHVNGTYGGNPLETKPFSVVKLQQPRNACE